MGGKRPLTRKAASRCSLERKLGATMTMRRAQRGHPAMQAAHLCDNLRAQRLVRRVGAPRAEATRRGEAVGRRLADAALAPRGGALVRRFVRSFISGGRRGAVAYSLPLDGRRTARSVRRCLGRRQSLRADVIPRRLVAALLVRFPCCRAPARGVTLAGWPTRRKHSRTRKASQQGKNRRHKNGRATRRLPCSPPV